MNQEATYKIASGMMAEIEAESNTTRRFLERIPEDKLSWRPHEKSMTAGQLAHHIATLQKGVLGMALKDLAELPDLSEPYQPESKEEILTAFAEATGFVTENLPTINDERMKETLKITRGDTIIFNEPRIGFLRMVLLNHLYHHRGQLGVYLRLTGASVPSSYGPSGDEAPRQAE